jgi:hypothetical protein
MLTGRIQPPLQDVAGDHERPGDSPVPGNLQITADVDQYRARARRGQGLLLRPESGRADRSHICVSPGGCADRWRTVRVMPERRAGVRFKSLLRCAAVTVTNPADAGRPYLYASAPFGRPSSFSAIRPCKQ